MKNLVLTPFFAMVFFAVAFAQTSFNPEILDQIRNVDKPQISPDGKLVVFESTELQGAFIRRIYSVGIDGSGLKLLSGKDVSAHSPRWSPDGSRIAFVQTDQIWLMSADGTDQRQLTSVSTKADTPLWSPDAKSIAFISEVFPECNGSEDCNANRKRLIAAAQYQEVNTLPIKPNYRQTRRHLLVASVDDRKTRAISTGNVDADLRFLSPTLPFAFSPDGNEIAFISSDESRSAESPSSEILVASLAGGTARSITRDRRGFNFSPRYSSDGRFMLFLTTPPPGTPDFRSKLMRFDRRTSQISEVTSNSDFDVKEFIVSADSQTVYFTNDERGRLALYSIRVDGTAANKTIANGSVSSIQFTPASDQFVFVYSFFSFPPEIVSMRRTSNIFEPLTRFNRQLVAQFGLRPPDETEWQGASKDRIHGYLFKPPNFSEQKKYPLIVLLGDGPAESWKNGWLRGWNPHIYAASGYVVFMPNPRGASGYGSRFGNQLASDWGGRIVKDITSGIEEIVRLPYVDRERVGAVGDGFGGFLVNWFAGRNESKRFRFRAFHSHSSIFNLETFFAATSQPSLPYNQLGGNPWKNPKQYGKWSPHRFAKTFRTPMLVTFSASDAIVAPFESEQLFAMLQSNRVESKLIRFNDDVGESTERFETARITASLDWFRRFLRPQ